MTAQLHCQDCNRAKRWCRCRLHPLPMRECNVACARHEHTHYRSVALTCCVSESCRYHKAEHHSAKNCSLWKYPGQPHSSDGAESGSAVPLPPSPSPPPPPPPDPLPPIGPLQPALGYQPNVVLIMTDDQVRAVHFICTFLISSSSFLLFGCFFVSQTPKQNNFWGFFPSNPYLILRSIGYRAGFARGNAKDQVDVDRKWGIPQALVRQHAGVLPVTDRNVVWQIPPQHSRQSGPVTS